MDFDWDVTLDFDWDVSLDAGVDRVLVFDFDLDWTASDEVVLEELASEWDDAADEDRAPEPSTSNLGEKGRTVKEKNTRSTPRAEAARSSDWSAVASLAHREAWTRFRADSMRRPASSKAAS